MEVEVKEWKGPIVIGICGKKGCGKTTVATHIRDNYVIDCELHSMADYLKNGVREFFGFSDEQLNGNQKEVVDPRYGVTPRRVLQVVGTDWMRERLEDMGVVLTENSIWVQRFHEFARKNPSDVIIVPDVRYPDEIDAILRYPDSKILFIERDDIPRLDTHKSEATEHIELRLFDIDPEMKNWVYVENDGNLEDLFDTIDMRIQQWFPAWDYRTIYC